MEAVLHQQEGYLACIPYLHIIDAVDLGQESVRVLAQMNIVLRQEAQQTLLLLRCNGLNDQSFVEGEKEEASASAQRLLSLLYAVEVLLQI